jgi:2-keto-3-deoxy-L-rhamnonate aldolase RhmA
MTKGIIGSSALADSGSSKTDSLKTCIQRGDVLVGGWLTVRSTEIAEALASTGVDWIAADFEHGTLDIGSASEAFAAIERHGVFPVARLTSMDADQACRALDIGAQGLLVPVVQSAEEFADFARQCLYSPQGSRGTALGRFNGWGDDFSDYRENFAPVLVPMIETRRGVEAAAEIAALDCVDALFFGPYDLSADLGDPGNFESAEFLSARARILEAAESAGKAAGGHQVAVEVGSVAKMVDDGFRFIAYGTDVVALRTSMSTFRDKP